MKKNNKVIHADRVFIFLNQEINYDVHIHRGKKLRKYSIKPESYIMDMLSEISNYNKDFTTKIEMSIFPTVSINRK